MKIFLLFAALIGAAYAAITNVPHMEGVIPHQWRGLVFLVFSTIMGLTFYITYRASQKVKNTSDFYTAGGNITGAQNGWAIAGDYLSAASFLGITGLISLYGYDGFTYTIGFLVAYLSVLLVIAEPCRNIGKYTLADILATRNDPEKMRILGAISVLMVSILYLTAQIVGGGILIKVLLGVEYETSLVFVGIIMIGYVLFGGMVATTWVQIIKAVLLVGSSCVLVALVWAPHGFSFPGFLGAVTQDAKIQAQVVKILGDASHHMSAAELGQRFLEPGLLHKDPFDLLSLGMALIFGTAGLPHILMRFFTVKTAQEARKSVIWAMFIVGIFYIAILFIGLGAGLNVGPDQILAIDKGGNMAAPLLAQYLGGGPDAFLSNLMLAFVAAVAFATIVAVVAGLVLACASAIAHDLYVGVLRKGQASAKEQIFAARSATIFVGIVSLLIGLLCKGQNVAHLVALAFAVAASANFPCLLMTLYWKHCKTVGIVAGMVMGMGSAVVLVFISPNMTYPLLVLEKAHNILEGVPAAGGKPAVQPIQEVINGLQSQMSLASTQAEKSDVMADLIQARKQQDQAQKDIAQYTGKRTSIVGLEKPVFPLKNPGIISIPLGFLSVVFFSVLWRRRDQRARDKWDEVHVKQNTGLGIQAGAHH